jgi:aspartate/methionine/tyrosine aminotransferase
MSRKILISSRITAETINQNVKNASYAVRGPIVTRSMEINQSLKTPEGQGSFPFKKVIACNIGNPHALGQRSLTFVRDVLSLVMNPVLLDTNLFPSDAVDRAKKYLKGTPDVGAYTESQGILSIREEVAKFLEKRDGYPSDPNDIFLTNGASEGVRFCMQTLLRDPREGFNDGVLTPIPQYPLYSALTTLLQGHQVPYYLDEEKEWGCSASFLTEALEQAQANGICPRAVVVINPGNPTGQILSEQTVSDIISWCKDNNICLMADEVYQENIWKKGAKFVSFRKVALDMKAFDGDNGLQMISFHSVSKVTCGNILVIILIGKTVISIFFNTTPIFASN